MTIQANALGVLPYSLLVGQKRFQLALEISFVDPGLGVLASGERGTAKSTTIRAFSVMAYEELPVTLPIGATEDRVLGGLDVEQLLLGTEGWREGLMEQASRSKGKMLYVDEVNLLDDHLVNILLDAASTGVLVVQRDNVDRKPVPVRFALVGTMNPEEGGLRPQLLDRFGLAVAMESEDDIVHRRQIVETVLRFEDELEIKDSSWLAEARAMDELKKARLQAARDRRRRLAITTEVAEACARVGSSFQVVGHRGDLILLRAARALAALRDAEAVDARHIREVAPLALAHRRPILDSGVLRPWTAEDDRQVEELLGEVVSR